MSPRKYRRVSRQLTILELLPPEPERPPAPPPSIAALMLRQATAFDPWDGQRPPPRKPRQPRKKYFASDPGDSGAEHAAAVVRGCLIERLEAAFEAGELGSVLWQPRKDERGNRKPPPEPVARFIRAVADLVAAKDLAGVLGVFESYGLRVFGDVLAAAFPEEYGVPAECSSEQEELLEEGGVVPFSGVERVGVAWLEALAARLGSARGA